MRFFSLWRLKIFDFDLCEIEHRRESVPFHPFHSSHIIQPVAATSVHLLHDKQNQQQIYLLFELEVKTEMFIQFILKIECRNSFHKCEG